MVYFIRFRCTLENTILNVLNMSHVEFGNSLSASGHEPQGYVAQFLHTSGLSEKSPLAIEYNYLVYTLFYLSCIDRLDLRHLRGRNTSRGAPYRSSVRFARILGSRTSRGSKSTCAIAAFHRALPWLLPSIATWRL